MYIFIVTFTGGYDDFGKWTSDFWDNNDYFNGIYSIRVAYISYETY